MFIESPAFPTHLAFGGSGGPGFRTSVVASRGGAEQRNQHWYDALRRWDVGLVNKSLAESQALLAFFNGVAVGRTNTFRFRDFLPGESTAVRSFLGYATGEAQQVQLRKTYTSGAAIYRRIITKPVAGTVQLFVDDIETDDFSVDTTTGVVTTTQDEGAVLRASCTFDVPVRFDVDAITMQRVDLDLYSWPSIPLQQVRLPGLDDKPLDDPLHMPLDEPPSPFAPELDEITTLFDPDLSQGIPRLFWTAGPPGPSPLVAYDVVRRPTGTEEFVIVATVGPTVLDWRETTLELDDYLLVLLSEAGFEYAIDAVFADESRARSNSLGALARIPFVIVEGGSFNSNIVYGALDFGQVPISALPHAVPDFGTLVPLVLAGTMLMGTHLTATVGAGSTGGGTNSFLIRDTIGRLSIPCDWYIAWEPS